MCHNINCTMTECIVTPLQAINHCLNQWWLIYWCIYICVTLSLPRWRIYEFKITYMNIMGYYLPGDNELTHGPLVMPWYNVMDLNQQQFRPDSTKPLPEPMLTYLSVGCCGSHLNHFRIILQVQDTQRSLLWVWHIYKFEIAAIPLRGQWVNASKV